MPSKNGFQDNIFPWGRLAAGTQGFAWCIDSKIDVCGQFSVSDFVYIQGNMTACVSKNLANRVGVIEEQLEDGSYDIRVMGTVLINDNEDEYYIHEPDHRYTANLRIEQFKRIYPKYMEWTDVTERTRALCQFMLDLEKAVEEDMQLS